MKRYSEADLIAFEHARAHATGCSVRRCECRYLQNVIEILTAYIRATVGVEPTPPIPPGEPPQGLDRRLWRWGVPSWKAAEYYGWERRYAEYYGWERRYAEYWARRAGGGV